MFFNNQPLKDGLFYVAREEAIFWAFHRIYEVPVVFKRGTLLLVLEMHEARRSSSHHLNEGYKLLATYENDVQIVWEDVLVINRMINQHRIIML